MSEFKLKTANKQRFGARKVPYTIIGNSLTAGTNTINGMSFPKLIQSYLPEYFYLLKNSGVGGRTSAVILANIDADVPLNTEVVVYHEGTNDAGSATPVSVASHMSNIRAIKQWCDDHNMLFILVESSTGNTGGTYTNFTSASIKREDEYTTAERIWAQENGVIFVSPWTKYIDKTTSAWDSSALVVDQLHPPQHVHNDVAIEIANQIKQGKPSDFNPRSDAGFGGILNPVNNRGILAINTSSTPATITLTAPLVAGTSATMTAVWVYPSGTYQGTFEDGSVRHIAFSTGSSAISWTGAVTAGTTVTMGSRTYPRDFSFNTMAPTTSVATRDATTVGRGKWVDATCLNSYLQTNYYLNFTNSKTYFADGDRLRFIGNYYFTNVNDSAQFEIRLRFGGSSTVSEYPVTAYNNMGETHFDFDCVVPTGTTTAELYITAKHNSRTVSNPVLTFSGALSGATSATMTSNWSRFTQTMDVMFSDGSIRTCQFTAGSPTVTWSGAVTATATANILFSCSFGFNALNVYNVTNNLNF